jgi:hypothetical protein
MLREGCLGRVALGEGQSRPLQQTIVVESFSSGGYKREVSWYGSCRNRFGRFPASAAHHTIQGINNPNLDPSRNSVIDRNTQALVVESIDLQRVRPPGRSELVGSHLRGDRLYGEVVSSRRSTLAVRSEIGPYRRPSPRYLALPKIIGDATPMKSSFPSTDGASQLKRSEIIVRNKPIPSEFTDPLCERVGF